MSGGAPPVSGTPARQASIGDPARVAVDASGNVYFGSLHSVFQVGASGALIRVAGTGRAGYSGDGGPATSAQLISPSGILADTAGNLYIADQGAHVIRRVASDGSITTYAGNGTSGFSGDGGPATEAQLNFPAGLALDAAGNLYIADEDNNRVRVVSPDGHISTAAGTGFGSYSGDGAPARNAELNSPEGLATDAAGNLYIADTRNYRIRKIGLDGTISTFAGTGNGNSFGDNGPANAAGLVLPTDVALDRQGNLYVADYGHSRIRVIAANGQITSVAGSDTGTPLADQENAITARLNGPTGLAVDSAGNFYFAEGSIGSGSGLAVGDFRIWKVSTDSLLTVLAGNGLESYSGDGAPPAGAQWNQPSGMAIDATGNLYVADAQNHRIRKIAPGGLVTTIAGTGTPGFSGDGGPAVNAQLDTPRGVAIDPAGRVVIADSGNSRIRIIGADGTISTAIGNGNSSYYGDGLNVSLASLNHPEGVAIAANGDIYVADTRNNAVRRITIDGLIHTIAGTGRAGFAGDGGAGTAALLNAPVAVALDGAGNVYVAEAGNGRVRKLAADGSISTVAAKLAMPNAVAVDGSGDLFISDGGAHAVFRIAPGSASVAIAGTGACCYSGDGGAATSAALDTPWGMAADAKGNLYFADAGANALRVLLPSGGAPALTSVVNGASNLAGPVAPGEVLVLYGAQMGPQQLSLAQVTGGAYPTELAGTAVLFDGTAAQILYSSASQVSVVAPNTISGPDTQISVEYLDVATSAATVAVAAAAPGLFTASGSGIGQAAALNADGTVNSAANPASGTISLYVTGISASSGLEATIGGQTAAVLLTQQTGGVLQITVQIPPGVSGPATAVTIAAGGVSSQAGVTIAIQ